MNNLPGPWCSLLEGKEEEEVEDKSFPISSLTWQAVVESGNSLGQSDSRAATSQYQCLFPITLKACPGCLEALASVLTLESLPSISSSISLVMKLAKMPTP